MVCVPGSALAPSARLGYSSGFSTRSRAYGPAGALGWGCHGADAGRCCAPQVDPEVMLGPAAAVGAAASWLAAARSSGLVHVPDPLLAGTSCVLGSLPACSCTRYTQQGLGRRHPCARNLVRHGHGHCTCFIDGRFTGLGTASFTPPSVLGRCACMQKIHELGSPVWQGRSQNSSASSAAQRRLLLMLHAARTLLSSRTPPFVRVAPPGAPTGFEPSAAFKLRFAYFWLLLGGCDILPSYLLHGKPKRKRQQWLSSAPPLDPKNRTAGG